MGHSTISVANAFIVKAKDKGIQDLSPMKLQKILFFAQSWSLKLLDRPLVEDFFAKWTYGPVLPQLYHAVKCYGSKNISSTISALDCTEGGGFQIVVPQFVDDSNGMYTCIIDHVLAVYGPMTAKYLSDLTHRSESAWSKTGDEEAVIDNRLLKECIVTEEKRFLSSAEFPFNFNLKSMECRIGDTFITIPDEVCSVEEMDAWLKVMIEDDC